MADIPSRNEPDPQNIRLRSFQGGADSLPDASPEKIPPKYRDMPQTVGSNTDPDDTGVTHSPTWREGGSRVRITEDR